MKQISVDLKQGFAVLIGNDRSQAAQMTIPPRGKEGGPGNRHRGADQWLYVVRGEGEATVNGKTVALSAGSLVLIEAGEEHEIRNTGNAPLATLNFYVPPAFSSGGDELGPGRP